MTKKIDWSLYEGPTKNKEYNYIYATWAAIGYSELPRCEDCDCDLTGKDWAKLILAGTVLNAMRSRMTSSMLSLIE